MGPEQDNSIPDQQSEKLPRRGRPPVPRDQVLRAAEALLADATTPASVSMDDIATAAGVGKGTLFRAFGSRDGLLDAVFEAQLQPLRAEVERPGSPVGPDAAPADRIVATLELLLEFKVGNPRLVSARELDGSSLMQAPHYRWVHAFLRDLVVETGAEEATADVTAHVLLGGLRAEVIAELTASGLSHEQIAGELRRAARRLVG
jgi:AcrR family transcriptional regulator